MLPFRAIFKVSSLSTLGDGLVVTALAGVGDDRAVDQVGHAGGPVELRELLDGPLPGSVDRTNVAAPRTRVGSGLGPGFDFVFFGSAIRPTLIGLPLPTMKAERRPVCGSIRL